VSVIHKQTAGHQEQLDKLAAEVHALREQLRRSQRLAAVGTMTAMVAHEFNNILTPIISYAQMAQSNPKLADKAITNAANGGPRASTICKAILGMTHAAEDASDVNLAELVAETLSAMARDVRKDGIELTLDVPAGLTLRAKQVELQQVLLNLIINARAALLAKEGLRELEISAHKHRNLVTMTVSDTGVGIAPENLKKIFEPFFTTKNGDGESDAGGNGLGLAICHDIITSMGGSISVQSHPGKGTKFSIRLPA
jgi:signal transduction histidine kinase